MRYIVAIRKPSLNSEYRQLVGWMRPNLLYYLETTYTADAEPTASYSNDDEPTADYTADAEPRTQYSNDTGIVGPK